MFRVVKKSKFELKPPSFRCDAKIHEQIVEPLPSRPFFMAVIGSAGSGKTSLAVNLLTSCQAYRKAFDRVHVIMPPHSVASLRNNIFKRHTRMHDDLDLETLTKIADAVAADAEEERSSLVLMDDVTASLKNNDVQALLRRLVFNRRHLRLSIILLAQTYNAVPLALRKTLSHVVAFRPRNKKEHENIFEELIPLPRERADALMRFVYQGDSRHGFMFLDVDRGLFHKGFDLVADDENLTPDQ